MFENIDIQGAIRRAIQTEKNAMDFYELGARKMNDPEARRVFELLSREERTHAKHFFKIYSGGDILPFDEFMDAPPDYESPWLSALTKTIHSDFSVENAMELALKKEKKLEKVLLDTAATIEDPDVRLVFELNARETRNHYQLIESEYARIMKMVHESDMDTYVRE